MQQVISTISRTILRATVYKGMRGLGMGSAVAVAAVAAVVMIVTG